MFPQVARQAHLLRGVFPVLFHPLPAPVWADDVDNRVNFGMDIGERLLVCHSAEDQGKGLTQALWSPGKARGFLKSGDMVIVVTGWIPGSGHTNIMRVVSAP